MNGVDPLQLLPLDVVPSQLLPPQSLPLHLRPARAVAPARRLQSRRGGRGSARGVGVRRPDDDD